MGCLSIPVKTILEQPIQGSHLLQPQINLKHLKENITDSNKKLPSKNKELPKNILNFNDNLQEVLNQSFGGLPTVWANSSYIQC